MQGLLARRGHTPLPSHWVHRGSRTRASQVLSCPLPFAHPPAPLQAIWGGSAATHHKPASPVHVGTPRQGWEDAPKAPGCSPHPHATPLPHLQLFPTCWPGRTTRVAWTALAQRSRVSCSSSGWLTTLNHSSCQSHSALITQDTPLNN